MSNPEAGTPGLRRLASPFRMLALAGALAIGLMALWLGYVVTVVLPARDADHIPLWTTVAISFLVYALLTLLFVVRGARPVALPWLVGALSLAAVGIGGHLLLAMAHADGAHFEGYLLLMGAILAAQGVCALGYTALTAAIARRARAA